MDRQFTEKRDPEFNRMKRCPHTTSSERHANLKSEVFYTQGQQRL